MRTNTPLWTTVGLIAGAVVGATLIAPVLKPAERPPPAAAATPAATPPAPAETLPRAEAPETAWAVATAYPTAVPHLGSLAKRLQVALFAASGGRFELTLQEPKTSAPMPDVFQGLAQRRYEAAFLGLDRFAASNPALALFSALPFGPEAGEYLAWLDHGGGRELLAEMMERRGLVAVLCGMIGPEAGGWFRREVRTIEDLAGMTVRFTGLGANVLARHGAVPVASEGGDIFLGFERGEIGAAEYATPAVDALLPFASLAKFYYFPGWHQPATALYLLVNASRWNGLSPAARAQLEVACGDNVRAGLSEAEALQFAALKTVVAKGVRLKRWPGLVLESLERTWTEWADAQAAKDPDFRRAWQSLLAFRRDYAAWNDVARPIRGRE